MFKRIITGIIILLMASQWDAFARISGTYHFSHLKSADGLPHQQVEAMAFDGSGRLWIGTRNGLACYDGYTFKTYYHDSADSTSLVYNFVSRLLVGSDNTIWIGSERGICRYRPETDDFKRYPTMSRRVGRICETGDGRIICCGDEVLVYDPSTDNFSKIPLKADNFVVGAAVSSDNRLFISTNFDMSVIDLTSGLQTTLDRSIYEDFINGFDCIAPMMFDHKGSLWIGRNGKGVMSVNLRNGEKKIYDYPVLTNGTVRAIAEDNNGLIWVGTESGLNAINPYTGDVKGVRQDLVNPNHLNDNAIYCIEPDVSGNLWIGTYFGGINILKNSSSDFVWIQPGYDSKSLRGKAIRRLAEPNPGELWIATEDGGLNIMNINDGDIRPFTKISDLGTNVHELYYDRENSDMWIGTFRHGLFKYNLKSGTIKRYPVSEKYGLPSDAVFCITEQVDTDGGKKIWVGTTQGLRVYDPNTDQFSTTNYPVLDHDFIYSILADHNGNMWIGTVNNGLVRMDGKTGKLMVWNNVVGNDRPSINDHYVTSIFEDADGRIFVGTNTGGLHYLDPSNLEIVSFPHGASMFGTVCMITQDKKGLLWITTSSGLFIIEPNNMKIRHLTVADGLPENQFNFASALQASDGRLYFGTVNGLISLTDDVVKKSDSPLPVHLWKLTANNREVSPIAYESVLNGKILDEHDEIEMSYDMSRTFTIDYGIINPASAASALYQVWLEGVDHDWRDVESLRQFTAMELAPGTYRLKIRSSSNSDAWDNAPIRELRIRISPPWYLSIWAFISYILLLATAIFFAVRLTKSRAKQKESIKLARIEKEKSDELNREKMEFFTIISHELKTPLSLILAPLKYLHHNESLTPAAKKRLGIAITNTNKMVGMIDELVTFNRMETGNFQLYLQKGNPLTMIEDLSDYFRESAAEKKIALNVYTENNGEEVWFSTTYLERIVNNLLSNSVKYTREGGMIDVRASIVEESGNIYLAFEVRDNGIGIAPEETQNIFRKYYQTKRGYKTDHSGWGIGLATVKKLVDAHKGSIEVQSVMGEGSTFKVRLNVAPDAFDPACVINGSAAQTPEQGYLRTGIPESTAQIKKGTRSPERVSVLLVEDNPELLSFLSEEFSANYNVFTATNGEEALKVTQEFQIDIVVSDVMMPVMDGLELCSKLKNDLTTSHIPVILLTAKTDDVSVMAGFESGAEAYVSKPFDPKLLELRVRNILRARRKFLRAIIEPDKEVVVDEADEATPQFNKFDKDFMVRINQLIEDNMDNSQFTIADITREFGISRSLLHVKMKSFVNCSMTDYIRHKRMERACKLLREGNNVSETAYSTGFSDPNYFSKVFKKEIGMTPTEFLNDSAENRK